MTRFAILFSGRGSNLEAILKHWSEPTKNPDTQASVPVLAVSNRPGAGGLDRARLAGPVSYTHLTLPTILRV